MKKLIYILLFLVHCGSIFSQDILTNDKNNGKIENKGTIRIRQAGQVKGLPDTLGGRVEFIADRAEQVQIVPNITYNYLLISGATNKYADSTWTDRGKNPLRTRDSLILDNTTFMVDTVEVNAQAAVKNTGIVKGRRDVRLNNEALPQTIEGRGKFANLNIDNPTGVDIVNGGGFAVNSKLELTRGAFRNDTLNNFSLDDSVLIVRHVGSSMAIEPDMGNEIKVKYVGTGSLVTTGELPSDTTKLASLVNETTEGVTLSRSVTVNRELVSHSRINTEPDSNNKHILTFTGKDDPVYVGKEAEISGSFRRTFVRFDGTRSLFNNNYTWTIFPDTISAASMREMTIRIKPKTFAPYDRGDTKVKRYITVSAIDSSGSSIKTGLKFEMGYGWRFSTDTSKDESNGLPVADLILQRWTGKEWYDIESSKVPANLDTLNEWAYSSATEMDVLGEYTIGLPGGGLLVLMSKVLLEGPYRFGSMAQDLRVQGLIPTSPPDIYPYNLDPNRQFISVRNIPDSVVDWIVLEFRSSFTSSDRFYRTAFVKVDGMIVDLDGVSPVLLSKGGIDSGEYYIAVRHRNHLGIITENKISIYPETMEQLVDFTNPSNIMGRTNALKPVGYDPNGKLLWAMFSGDVNGDGVVDQTDLVLSWEERDFEGYYGFDSNLSGIINTRDFNFNWNNQGQATFLPN